MYKFYLEILPTAFWLSINWIGYSGFVFIYLILLAALSLFAIHKKGGWKAVKIHIFTNLLTALALAILAWIPFFILAILHENYGRFNSQMDINNKLRAIILENTKKIDSRESLKKENEHLAKILSAFVIVAGQIDKQKTESPEISYISLTYQRELQSIIERKYGKAKWLEMITFDEHQYYCPDGLVGTPCGIWKLHTHLIEQIKEIINERAKNVDR